MTINMWNSTPLRNDSCSPTTILLGVLFLALFANWSPICAQAAERPNVIVVLTDDQGWGDLSLHGNTNLSTPNIDALARSGAQFDRFFVCPVCSPTRAEFLTGRYHTRSGVYSTSAGGERINLDEQTIAETFSAAGYATAAFGKWHNGMQTPYHPNSRGFDEYYGFCSGHWGNYFDPMLEHNGKLVRGRGFVIDDFTNHAMKFIEDHRDKPFFVYLPYNTPHSPMQVPDRWWKKFADKELKLRHRDPRREKIGHTRAALAMCENIDWNVGRLLAKLDELEIADNTIVVYFCDNGPNGFRFNGGMKGRKGSTDEGGVRSPLLVRWPKAIEAGAQVPQISAAIDLLPTLADLAGVKVISKKPLDGVSLKPLLLRRESPWRKRLIFSHWRNRISVRTQQYRLGFRGQLFDMSADPRQEKNVAGEHPQLTAKLKAAVEKWRDDVQQGFDQDDRAFPIGGGRAPLTQLPARDAKTAGGIERSNRFPNCSYFHDWKSADDRITWDVEVQTAGSYEVEVYYACPAEDVGSTIELSFRDYGVRNKLTIAHDPPLVGAAEDRVPRGESYVKYFKPWKLGRITLPRGRGQLALRALEIPGGQAMEFRLLMLRRVDD
ncbi:MAG: sulfatase-like hydrolase/transferase [Pirellulaceae bacterium]|jgi:arylsulfatase A-like enzyme|nr:sulfatase-like hydrolase/transferase [Pirellulaceae bacterium]MDP7018326.1 sulfatase-like hydrolase/transferase [Pirellulaceae bacterium]